MRAKFLNILRALNNDESGQDLIEYALVASLIALGSVASMQSLSSAINTAFTSIDTALKSTT
jgi:pilus assembly protein Flp/PilA